MKFVSGIFGMTLALVLIGPSAWGQTADSAAAEKAKQDSANARADTRPFQTFYLTNTNQVNDANEIVIAVRNLLPPDVRVYLAPSQNAILMRASPDQLLQAQKIINDLDRPKKTYRLTYTITEMEGGKRVGIQHFAMIVVSGQRTVMKQGSRVPIVTGSYDAGTSKTQNQVTYIDVGINFDATLDPYANGARLRGKVEQSSVAEERSGVGPEDPVVRQILLESMSFLVPGKPVVLGSLDIPGSTRHLDVDVVMEQVAQ
jgi:type II secretory pathway component GspD/PulD (secretin)